MVTDTIIALVERGALPGSMQLDMGNVGMKLFDPSAIVRRSIEY